SEEVLVKITGEILNTLGDIWKSPAFTPKFENTQSEGTYVTDFIVLLLQMTLKKLPVRKIALLST
ncbi:10043_t:CDS:2, partial [Funneliformis geosporum]